MRSSRAGFTLVELLVVITIIGILVSLSMPAIQSARESARQAQCENNLKQMGLGASQHISSLNRYPTNGWGWTWIGDPDCGTGKGQPGGWIYNLLPYMDQQVLHDFGAGQPPQSTTKLQAGFTLITTPLPALNCPSRRRSQVQQNYYGYTYYFASAVGSTPQARTDYAVNEGDRNYCEIDGGPSNSGVSSGTQVPVGWYGVSDSSMFATYTGIAYRQSMILPGHVTDGTPYVIFSGEKYLDPDDYLNGADAQDNENMYVGMDNDIGRVTSYQFIPDTPGNPNTCGFGSPHLNGGYFVFCDGSVRLLSYAINTSVFNNLGNRADGNLIDDSTLIP